MDEKNKTMKDWMKFLNPEEVKFQLMCASLYITAYELLIDSIVKKTKDFFLTGYKDGQNTYDLDEYKKVREFYPKDIVIASAMWIQDLNGIDKDDIDKIKKFKDYRNDVAHELSKFISDTSHEIKVEYFKELKALYRKINLWWFTDFEIGINPDLDNIEINELDFDEVLTFVMLPMNYIENIVNDEVKKREKRGENNLK